MEVTLIERSDMEIPGMLGVTGFHHRRRESAWHSKITDMMRFST
jgi:hypothetical protein